MTTDPTDPLAEFLSQGKPTNGGSTLKVELLFGDRPQVLDEIRKARVERKLGFKTIADLITKAEPQNAVSDTAIENWLKHQGIS